MQECPLLVLILVHLRLFIFELPNVLRLGLLSEITFACLWVFATLIVTFLMSMERATIVLQIWKDREYAKRSLIYLCNLLKNIIVFVESRSMS